MKKTTVILTLFLALAILVSGCAGSPQPTQAPNSTQNAATQAPTQAATATPANVELLISAASSLKNAMTEIQTLYAKSAPNVKLTFNFQSSGTLQTQIEQGAPCDLFFSAAQTQMDALDKKSLLLDGTRKNLLENKVVLVVPKGKTSPATFQDLANATGQIGLGDPKTVPAGQYAEEILTSLKILDKVKSKAVYGKDVTEVLTWVASGNVTAGVVYATDALSNKDVTVMAEAPQGSHTPVVYPAAALKASKNAEAAKAFLAFLQTDAAKNVFKNYGFTSL